MSENIVVNISPPKCGTTSLYFSLCRSEHVRKPKLKEPRFFLKSRDRISEVPDSIQVNGNYQSGINWFLDLYEEKLDAKYLVDFSTYYSIGLDTPELVKHHYPDAKLVFIVRDPVDRFVSHYYQYIRMGANIPSLTDVVYGDTEFGNLMFEFADYQRIYDRYVNAFSRDSILLLDFESLVNDGAMVQQSVGDFLEVSDYCYQPKESEKNKASQPKSLFLQKLMYSDTARAVARKLFSTQKTMLLRLRKKIVNANIKENVNPELDVELEATLRKKLEPQIEFYQNHR